MWNIVHSYEGAWPARAVGRITVWLIRQTSVLISRSDYERKESQIRACTGGDNDSNPGWGAKFSAASMAVLRGRMGVRGLAVCRLCVQIRCAYPGGLAGDCIDRITGRSALRAGDVFRCGYRMLHSLYGGSVRRHGCELVECRSHVAGIGRAWLSMWIAEGIDSGARCRCCAELLCRRYR